MFPLILAFLSSLLTGHSGEMCPTVSGTLKSFKQVEAISFGTSGIGCTPLEKGKVVDINVESKDSITAVPQRYRLARLSEKKYQITFNIEFFKDVGKLWPTPSADPQLTKDWRTNIAKCLKDLDGKVTAPDGTSMTFKIYDGLQGKSAPPPNLIGMRETGRPNAGSWVSNLECPGMFHELLHLAGLVDEYTEKSIGYVQDPKTKEWYFQENVAAKTAFDCRKIYSKNTIMGHDSLAWSFIQSNWQLRIGYCKCQQRRLCSLYKSKQKYVSKNYKNMAHEQIIALFPTKPGQCPDGFIQSGYAVQYPVSDEMKTHHDKTGIIEYLQPIDLPKELQDMPETIGFLPISQKEKLLLDERHINALIFPGCLAANFQYYQDSLNAYQTSLQNNGEGCFNLTRFNAK